MALMLFYSYIPWHETTRKRPAVGTPPPTGDPAFGQEQVRVGHSSHSQCIEELSHSMARGLQEAWFEGTPSQTHAWASAAVVHSTEKETGKVSLERSPGHRLLNRPLDIAAYRQADRKTLPCELSSESCLAATSEDGMELPEAGTPSAPKGRRSDCPVETERLAPHKKKPQYLAPISYSWMKAAFCSSPMCDAHGHPEVRHRTSTIGSSRTESPPSALLASLHAGDTPDFTCSSARAVSSIAMSKFSCSIFSGTCEDRLYCCGIAEQSTVIILSNRSLTNIRDSIQNSSPLMRLNLTRRNTSGTGRILRSPILSPTLGCNSITDCIPSRSSSELPRSVSGRAFMQVDCHGEDEILSLYLCEPQ